MCDVYYMQSRTSLNCFLTSQYHNFHDHSLPPSSLLRFLTRAWHLNDKTDSWSCPRPLTHTQAHSHWFPAASLIWPPNASSISQKTHRVLHTQKEQACQRRHSLVWLREGQMALNHTSSPGHIIKRHQFVCVVGTLTDRPPTLPTLLYWESMVSTPATV